MSEAEPRPLLHFLGDSHLRAPRFAAEQGWFAPWQTQFTLVGGATAIGLRHPTSQTQALEVYRAELVPHRSAVVPIFQLGEVDCGFVVWLRSRRYGESVDLQVEQSIEAYARFLAELSSKGYRDILVTSAVLPTIRDGQLDGHVAHLRREVEATLLDRTALTLRYNSRLEAVCAHQGLHFVDLSRDLIDPKTGVLSDAFRHPDPEDHHLNNDTGGKLWVRRIKDMLNELNSNWTR